jgi:hypothetical protein
MEEALQEARKADADFSEDKLIDPFENFNFDILDIDNEYLTFEEISDDTIIVTRG